MLISFYFSRLKKGREKIFGCYENLILIPAMARSTPTKIQKPVKKPNSMTIS